MFNKSKLVNILGINFLSITNKQFVDQLKTDSNLHLNRFVVTANPEIVLAARKDKEYANIINSADYVVADGIGIIKGAKILKKPLPERVTGYDTMLSLLSWANQEHKKIYFLGAKPEVAQTLSSKIKETYPGIHIAGINDGYFKDDSYIVETIKNSNPDIIFVALGFPKQEFFINEHRHISDSIWMGVGGSFDVLAGYSKHAPIFWQKHHLEWFYRLLQEPQRIIRMMALPKYMLLIYRKKFLKK